MKPKYGFIIGAGATFLILAFLLIVPVLYLEGNWWWFFGFLIAFGVIWLIILFVVLALKLSKKKPKIEEIDLTEAKARAIHQMKYDRDNPDNFVIDKSKKHNLGEKGAEKTPVIILEGHGTETNTKRTVVMNGLKPEMISFLIDPTNEEVEECARKIAENPPEIEIREEIGGGMDAFGRPLPSKIKITRPTSAEIKEKKEQEKEEENKAM